MKIVKTVHGVFFLSTNEVEPVTLTKNFFGKYTGAHVMIQDLAGLIKNSDSPVLEDLFAAVNSELQKRDKKTVEENLK